MLLLSCLLPFSELSQYSCWIVISSTIFRSEFKFVHMRRLALIIIICYRDDGLNNTGTAVSHQHIRTVIMRMSSWIKSLLCQSLTDMWVCGCVSINSEFLFLSFQEPSAITWQPSCVQWLFLDVWSLLFCSASVAQEMNRVSSEVRLHLHPGRSLVGCIISGTQPNIWYWKCILTVIICLSSALLYHVYHSCVESLFKDV